MQDVFLYLFMAWLLFGMLMGTILLVTSIANAVMFVVCWVGLGFLGGLVIAGLVNAPFTTIILLIACVFIGAVGHAQEKQEKLKRAQQAEEAEQERLAAYVDENARTVWSLDHDLDGVRAAAEARAARPVKAAVVPNPVQLASTSSPASDANKVAIVFCVVIAAMLFGALIYGAANHP